MKAPAFEYMRPTTVSEAAGLLAASDGYGDACAAQGASTQAYSIGLSITCAM